MFTQIVLESETLVSKLLQVLCARLAYWKVGFQMLHDKELNLLYLVSRHGASLSNFEKAKTLWNSIK